MKEHVAIAETVEEALALALSELGKNEDEVTVEVLEEPGKKLFGGRKDAVVKVIFGKESDAEGLEDSVVEAKELVDEILEYEIDKSEKGDKLFDIEDLTDDQIDAIADAGIEYLKKLIGFLSETEISIEEFEGDEGEIILDVSGENVGTLIGRHGRTIDALQVVVSAMTTKKMGVRYPLSVDVEGYKHRRRQKVIDIAQRAASRAERTGRPVALKSMSPQERRIVHMALRDFENVTTTSEGGGAYRHVVIVPV